jgi:exopolysaccharide biosynthesis predicted pyruvyltransferase EpsI
MTFLEKCNLLKEIIKEKLSAIITCDCWLLGLPYYHCNIGDFLIWQGVELFLSDANICCKYRASSVTYRKKKGIPPIL